MPAFVPPQYTTGVPGFGALPQSSAASAAGPSAYGETDAPK
ncbi:hypothetical protein [Paenibacillus sp. 22594]